MFLLENKDISTWTKHQYHLSLIFPQEAEMNSVEVTTPTSSVVSLSPQHKLQDEDDSHCNVNTDSTQTQHNPISVDQSSQSAYATRPSIHMSRDLCKVENTLYEPLL